VKAQTHKLILLGAVLCFTPFQMFAPAFMKLGDIKGEATDADYRDTIEIQSFSLGASNPATATGGGRVSFSDLSLVKKLDASSPLLYLNAAKGQVIPTATLHLTRSTEGGQEEYYMITMTDVLVTSVQSGGSAGGSGPLPTESISLNYTKIEFTYWPQSATGGLGEPIRTGWDIKNNVEIRPDPAN